MEQTSTSFFKNFKKLHKVMVVMHILFPLLVILLLKFVNTKVDQYEQFHNIMQWVVPVVLITCIIGATIVFKKKVDEILAKQNISLQQKLTEYRSASIIRWSIIDLPIGL
jgi:uncharacterized alpha/beta hydrolase family protein